jgi:RNA polymerase sigma factor
MRIWLKDPESTIIRIQAGDDELRNEFIRESLPFVRHAVFKVTRDFYAEKSEDFSVALEAYNRSIDRFKTEKKVPFEPFARIIIRNSVLNRIRSEYKSSREQSMTDTQNDQGEDVSRSIPGSDGRETQRNLEFEEAMAETESKLQMFGLTLRGLPDRIPKHADTRRLCIKAARILSEPDLQKQMNSSRKLPVKALSQRTGIPVKTIEKNRAAIILYEALLSCGPDSIRYYAKAFEEGK